MPERSCTRRSVPPASTRVRLGRRRAAPRRHRWFRDIHNAWSGRPFFRVAFRRRFSGRSVLRPPASAQGAAGSRPCERRSPALLSVFWPSAFRSMKTPTQRFKGFGGLVADDLAASGFAQGDQLDPVRSIPSAAKASRRVRARLVASTRLFFLGAYRVGGAHSLILPTPRSLIQAAASLARRRPPGVSSALPRSKCTRARRTPPGVCTGTGV